MSNKIRRLAVTLLLGLFVLSHVARAQLCGTPGKDGPGGVLAGVVNNYWTGTGTVTAGVTTTITLGASRNATPTIAVGDLLLIIQMQDATINTTNSIVYGDGSTGSGCTSAGNSGRYEYIVARSTIGAAGGSLTFDGAGTGGNTTIITYTAAAATATSGQKTYQVVRVPQYTSALLGSTLTASAWNGATGGILALDVRDQLDLNYATVSVDGLGFRAGGGAQLTGSAGANTDYLTRSSVATNANKGEGIAGTPITFYNGTAILATGSGYPFGSGAINGDRGRGAPGNAGGGGTDGQCDATNQENTGGGGGANGGRGGMGGRSWNTGFTSGGLGGSAVAGVDVTRVVLGGGGGAGTNNNNAGQSSGTCGGGIIMIRTGTVTGSGTITANGAAPVNTTANDGGGGGGAGGSIILTALSGTWANARVYARGARGENANATAAPGGTPPAPVAPGSPRNPVGAQHHGPGAGGGGGVIILSSTAAATDVSGGTTGITTTGNVPFSAQPGSSGVTVANALPTVIPGCPSGAENHHNDGPHLDFRSAPVSALRNTNQKSVVMAQTTAGTPYNVTSNTTLALISTTGSTNFYTDATYTTTTTSVVMASGTDSVTLYWRETSQPAIPTITATRSAGDLAPVGTPARASSASQIQHIYRTIDHFALLAPPSAVVNGAFALMVAALDASGNIIQNYAGTVTFTATGAGNILPANYTFVPATDQGIHTFVAGTSTKLGTLGSQTITVAQGGNNGTAVVYVYPAVTITSAASDTFTIGSAGTFTVTTAATPAYTTSPAPVLTVQGTLPAGVTFVDNGDGTATIAGTPTVPGTYTFTIMATYGPSQYDAVQSPFTLRIGTLAVDLSMLAVASGPDGAVTITWRTESENDCYLWQIERSVEQEKGYAVIGSVPGHGTTSEAHSYAFTDTDLKQAGIYYYRLTEQEISGSRTSYGPVMVTFRTPSISAFQAGKIWPNPAGDHATISLQLPRPGTVEVAVYNLAGQKVRAIADGAYPAGPLNVSWDGRDGQGQRQASGVYLIRASYQDAGGTLGKQSIIRRLMLTR